ncbi:MAG: hypothetical protein HY049_02355 [Acidobacteria bacterium]|nr:hypothetical protein [Acidobacteriota bacterium]
MGVVVTAIAGGINPAGVIDGGPWSRIVYDAAGNVVSAAGRTSQRTPMALTVATSEEPGLVVATTTFVRGEETLRMERVYDEARGLEVTYSAGAESAKLFIKRDADTGETSAVVVLADGEVRAATLGERGNRLSGDARGVREAFLERSHLFQLVREFERNASMLGGPVPEAPCLDGRANGRKNQCAWECALSGVSCGICKSSCAAGCSPGMALDRQSRPAR